MTTPEPAHAKLTDEQIERIDKVISPMSLRGLIRAIDSTLAVSEAPAEPAKMIVGGAYNWKHEPADKLIYLGRARSWHQFKKIGDPRAVWCEVLDEDLHMVEPTDPAKGGHAPTAEPSELCWVCNGSGEAVGVNDNGITTACPRCKGTGMQPTRATGGQAPTADPSIREKVAKELWWRFAPLEWPTFAERWEDELEQHVFLGAADFAIAHLAAPAEPVDRASLIARVEHQKIKTPETPQAHGFNDAIEIVLAILRSPA